MLFSTRITADLPPNPDSNLDTSWVSERESMPNTPRWVKVFGIIILILVLLFGIIVFTGIGGEHGPGRHIRSGGPGSHTLPIEYDVQQP